MAHDFAVIDLRSLSFLKVFDWLIINQSTLGRIVSIIQHTTIRTSTRRHGWIIVYRYGNRLMNESINQSINKSVDSTAQSAYETPDYDVPDASEWQQFVDYYSDDEVQEVTTPPTKSYDDLPFVSFTEVL